MEIVARTALGLALSALIAAFAWRRGSLSGSGALAALPIGAAIYVGGGAAWFGSLLTFFATSTLLGKVGRARKAAIKRAFEKSDTRDARQAFANGGVAALCALGMLWLPDPRWAGAFVGALATANGDTWATELGTLSRGEPFSLTRFTRVARGTSGAVSALGLGATAAGGAAIGLTAGLGAASFAQGRPQLLGIGLSCGLLGALADSLLGATLQAQYRCEQCQVSCEAALHSCGQRARQVRGFAWFDNDLVNLLATLCGAGLGALAALPAR